MRKLLTSIKVTFKSGRTVEAHKVMGGWMTNLSATDIISSDKMKGFVRLWRAEDAELELNWLS